MPCASHAWRRTAATRSSSRTARAWNPHSQMSTVFTTVVGDVRRARLSSGKLTATVDQALQLKVFLMGGVAFEANGHLLDERRLPGRQGRLLFAYLAAAPGRPVPRDELAEAIWGETPPATWEKGLTVVVSKLRSVLAADGIVLTNAFGCYRLELPEGSWVDVAVASNAARDAEEALAAGDGKQAKAAAACAVALLSQPFLPGEETAWVERERRELADVQGRALNVLAEACLLSGDAAEAAEWAEQTISLTPYRETGYRRLMEAHVAAGNPAEALRVYERCRRLLADELGTYPSLETESIYRALLEVPARPPPTTELHGTRAGRRPAVILGGGMIALAAGIAAVALGDPGARTHGQSSKAPAVRCGRHLPRFNRTTDLVYRRRHYARQHRLWSGVRLGPKYGRPDDHAHRPGDGTCCEDICREW